MCFKDDEIEISFFKSRGPGGQKKNVTESAVRVRHIPTGMIVIATESRSQHRNKQLALEELERRLAARRRRRTPRIKTRPSLSARRERVDEKKHRGAIKRLRQTPGDD